MNGDAHRITLLVAKSADAFPAVEIIAAIPAEIVSDDEVRAAADAFPANVARAFGELLQADLATHGCGMRPLGENEGGWTHWLRLVGNEGDAPFADFIVMARGLPASEAEARAHGYERAEFIVARLPLPSRRESLN